MANFANLRTYRLSPNEIELLMTREREQRRQQRIKQVRAQSNDMAKTVRTNVLKERNAQLTHQKNRIQQKWLADKELKIEALQKELAKCNNNIGSAHRHAKDKENEFMTKQAETLLMQKKSEKRGNEAAIKAKNDKAKMRDSNLAQLKAKRQAVEMVNAHATDLMRATKRQQENIFQFKSDETSQSQIIDVSGEKEVGTQTEDNATNPKSVDETENKAEYEIKHQAEIRQEKMRKQFLVQEYRQLLLEIRRAEKMYRLKKKAPVASQKIPEGKDTETKEAKPQVISDEKLTDKSCPGVVENKLSETSQKSDSEPMKSQELSQSDLGYLIAAIKKQQQFWKEHGALLEMQNQSPSERFSTPTNVTCSPSDKSSILPVQGSEQFSTPTNVTCSPSDKSSILPVQGSTPHLSTSTLEYLQNESSSLSTDQPGSISTGKLEGDFKDLVKMQLINSSIHNSPITSIDPEINLKNKQTDNKINAFHRHLLSRSSIGRQILKSNSQYSSVDSNLDFSQFSLNAQTNDQKGASLLPQELEDPTTKTSFSGTNALSASGSEDGNLKDALKKNNKLAKIILKETAEKLERQGILKKSISSSDSSTQLDLSSPRESNNALRVNLISDVSENVQEDKMKETCDVLANERSNIQIQLDKLEKFKTELEQLSFEQLKERLSTSSIADEINVDRIKESSSTAISLHPLEEQTCDNISIVRHPFVRSQLDLSLSQNKNASSSSDTSSFTGFNSASFAFLSPMTDGGTSTITENSQQSTSFGPLSIASSSVQASQHLNMSGSMPLQPLQSKSKPENISTNQSTVTSFWSSSSPALSSNISVGTSDLLQSSPSFLSLVTTSHNYDASAQQQLEMRECFSGTSANQTSSATIHVPSVERLTSGSPPRDNNPSRGLFTRTQSTPTKQSHPFEAVVNDYENFPNIADEPDLTFADSQLSSVSSSAASTPNRALRRDQIFDLSDDQLHLDEIELARHSMQSQDSILSTLSNLTIKPTDYTTIAEHPLSPNCSRPDVEDDADVTVQPTAHSSGEKSSESEESADNTLDSVQTVIRVPTELETESLLSFEMHKLSSVSQHT